MKKRQYIVLFLCMIAAVGMLGKFKKADAAVPDAEVKEGMLIFNTTDTKATNSITWETAGFIITRDKCLTGGAANGGYPLKLDHGMFTLKPEWKDEIDAGGGKVNVTFTVPEKVVNKALIDAGLDEIQPNDTIYLHAIHRVKHNGRPYGSLKYDYPSIRNAEGWANPVQ